LKKIIFFAFFLFSISNLFGGHFPYKYKEATLANGLKIISIPMNSPGIVSYYTIVRTGSRDEWEVGRSGFAHFFEHIMFRGTKRHPGKTYDSLVISMGADANAYTTDDYTCYHLSIAKEDLEKVMDLESDRFQNLDYSETAFKTESGAVYGEYRKGRTQPFNVLWEKMKETAFKEHTYSHTTIGYENDIKNMPNLYEYSKEFYKRYYRPENCIVVIAGDIADIDVKALSQKYYGGWSKGYVQPQIKAESIQTSERKANVIYEGKTNPIIAIGYKGESFNPTSKSYIATILLGQLAFGENSELNNRLYLQEQKVQSISPSFNYNRDPFLWLIYAQVTNNSDVEYVKNELLNTITKYQNEKPDEKKLNDLKSFLKYSYIMKMDTPDKVAGGLARILAITGDMSSIDKYFETMDSVTPTDIQNAAKNLTAEKRNIVILKGNK